MKMHSLQAELRNSITKQLTHEKAAAAVPRNSC